MKHDQTIEAVNLSALPPSVAAYFEQKLGAELPNPFTGGATTDKKHPASPAHPEFHIHTGCGIDCRAAIDAAALVLAYLRASEETPDTVSTALIGAAALLTFLDRSIPLVELKRAATQLLEAISGQAERRGDGLLDVTRMIAAEIVNCYVYA
jgi:hypothetical protein